VTGSFLTTVTGADQPALRCGAIDRSGAARPRAIARCIAHGRACGGDQKPLSHVSGGRRDVLPDAAAGALGRAQFHREGSGWQSAVIRRACGIALVLRRHCEPTGRREAPPDDRLREAIHASACGAMDCFVASAQNCSAILSRAPRNDGCRKFRRVGKAKRAHHHKRGDKWWARRKSAFAHPTHFCNDGYDERRPNPARSRSIASTAFRSGSTAAHFARVSSVGGVMSGTMMVIAPAAWEAATP
jgi:hypothetical protein